MLRNDAEIMGDQHHRHAGLVAQRGDQREHLRLHRHVERGGRLVREQQARPAGQRQRDRDALRHAAGDLVRIGTQLPLRLGQADAAEQRGGLGAASHRL